MNWWPSYVIPDGHRLFNCSIRRVDDLSFSGGEGSQSMHITFDSVVLKMDGGEDRSKSNIEGSSATTSSKIERVTFVN